MPTPRRQQLRLNGRWGLSYEQLLLAPSCLFLSELVVGAAVLAVSVSPPPMPTGFTVSAALSISSCTSNLSTKCPLLQKHRSDGNEIN